MKKIVCLLCLLAVLSGCSQYKATALPDLAIIETPNQVQVKFHPLTKQESNEYLGKKLQNAHILPIQIQIVNTTQEPVLFSPENLSVPSLSLEEVLDKTTHPNFLSSAILITGINVGGGIILSGVVLAGLASLLGGPFLAPIAVATVIGATPLTASIATKKNMDNAKEKYAISRKSDYEKKILVEQSIPPYTSVNGVVFTIDPNDTLSYSLNIVGECSNRVSTFHGYVDTSTLD